MISCPSCSTQNPAAASFCFQCGTGLAAVCPECGSPLPVPEARFCPSCGARLVPEHEDEHMLKPVSVLFADVVGSTARAETMHAEDVRDLMADFFAAMTQEIRAESGRIEKFMGDAVMAVFGVPQAHEDDPVRAVRAAKRMFARLEQWNSGREELHKIRIRIGINTGGVLAAAPGADLEVTGDPVNVAARLEQAAAAGTILIGERTARVVRAYFHLTPSEPLTLKGKSEPVPAYVVGDAKEATQGRGLLGRRAPLIGRDEELKRLRNAFANAASSSRPRLVSVVGEAGLGKSRLIEEFISSVQLEARVVSGRCLPYGEGVTLWPLAEILMAEAGILLTDPPELTQGKLTKLVRSELPSASPEERDRIAAGLGSTLGGDRSSPRLADLDPRERFRELLSAWRSLLTGLASDRPLVVVVDDIHWADETMLAVLKDQIRTLATSVLFVCPTRPEVFTEERAWLQDPPQAERLDLQALTAQGSGDLIDGLLGSVDVPEELRERMLEKAEGNPLFIEEILQRMIDEGHLVESPDGWQVVADISAIEIPDNVQGVLLARIDRLEPGAKKVLQNAAVMGRTFWEGALEAVSEQATSLLRDLEERQLVFRSPTSSMAGQVEYSFKHILIRDVAYETLPRKRRARHHVHVAEWITEVSGKRSDELAELLAHHYHQAHTYSRDHQHRLEARRLYGHAARSACQRFAIRQAETYGWLVVDLSEEGAERVDALETLGDLFCTTGGMDGAWQVYTEGLQQAGELPPDGTSPARLAAKAAIVATRFENMMKTPLSAEEVNGAIKKGLEALGDQEDGHLSILLASKAIMQSVGYEPMDEEGERAAVRSLEVAEKVGDPDTISIAIDALTYRLLPRGLYGRIHELARRRIALVPDLHDLQEICDAYKVAAWSAAFIGRYADGSGYATDCIERARGADAGNYIQGLVVRVRCRFMSGDWEGALADQAEIERLEAEQDHELPPPYLWQAYAIAAGCRMLRGDEAEGARYLQILSRVIADAPRATEGPTLFGALFARALLHGGDPAAAGDLLQTEESTALCSHLESLCDLAIVEGDLDEAEKLVPQARRVAAEGGLIALPLFADRCEGWAAVHAGDLTRGRSLLERAAAGFAGIGAPWEEAYSRLLLGAGLVEGGGTAAAAEQLSAAADGFSRLGSRTHADRAGELLARTRE